MAWPDITYPDALDVEIVSLDGVLSGWAGHNQHILGALQQSIKDYDRFVFPTADQLHERLRGSPVRDHPGIRKAENH